MTKYIVIKKVVSEYELEVQADSPEAALKMAMDNQDDGDLVDDYYVNPLDWAVFESE